MEAAPQNWVLRVEHLQECQAFRYAKLTLTRSGINQMMLLVAGQSNEQSTFQRDDDAKLSDRVQLLVARRTVINRARTGCTSNSAFSGTSTAYSIPCQGLSRL